MEDIQLLIGGHDRAAANNSHGRGGGGGARAGW